MNKTYLFIFFMIVLSAACLPTFSASSSDTPTTSIETATVEILPTSTSTLTPPKAEPSATQAAGLDRVNIYLVAVGDNGASGKLIGCGDSLIPVVVEIEPTLGVLRASLNELFKLEGQSDYAGSGLYNALYLSHLTIDDVSVINGEARIELQGELITGGECDIPRIEEQLRAAALQFNTVDQVSITVNGVPLEDLLDLRE